MPELRVPAPPRSYPQAALATRPTYYWRLGTPSAGPWLDTVTGLSMAVSAGTVGSVSGLVGDNDNGPSIAVGSSIAATLPALGTAWTWAGMVRMGALGAYFLSGQPCSAWFNALAQVAVSAAGGAISVTGGTVAANVAAHVAITSDGTNVRLYVNGAEAATTTGVATAAAGAMTLGPSAANATTVVLDEVGIWSRALGADEVAALYAAVPVMPYWPGIAVPGLSRATKVTVAAVDGNGVEGPSVSTGLVVPTLGTGTWAARVAALNPVAWWRSPTASGLTLTAGTAGSVVGWPSLVPGDPDLAASFPGGGARAAGTVDLGNGSWSAGLIFQTTSPPGAQRIALDLTTGAGVTFFGLNATQQFVFWPAGGPQLNGPPGLADGKPHLAVLTWNGIVLRMFVDGAEITGAAAVPSQPAQITGISGSVVRTLGGFNGSWIGQLDEPFFVQRDLAPNEIASLWGAIAQPVSPWAQKLASVPNLSSWWRLDEGGTTFQDSIGTRHFTTKAASVGNAPSLLPYDDNRSGYFPNGANATTAATTLSAQWSVGIFAQTPSVAYVNRQLLMVGPSSQINLYVNYNYGLCISITGASPTVTTFGGGWGDNAPHFVVVTWDGTSLIGYVDGVQVGATATPTGVPDYSTLSYPVLLGGTGLWDGMLDEAFWVSRALSAQEVADLQAAANTPPPPAVPTYPNAVRSTAGLRHYWRLGGSGPWTDEVAGITTNTNATVTSVAGLVGDDDGGLNFTGTGIQAQLPPLGDAWTWTVLFSTTNTTTNYMNLLFATQAHLSLWPTAPLSQFLNTSGTSNTLQPAAPNPRDGNVHLAALAVTTNPGSRTASATGLSLGSARLYLDGVQLASGNFSTAALPAINFIIGNNATGVLDEVALFDRALSAPELLRLYNMIPASLPAAPATATSTVGALQAQIAWTAPPSLGTGTLTAYRVRYDDVVVDFPATLAGQPITGLSSGRRYVFSVSAVTTVGEGPPRVCAPVFPFAHTATTTAYRDKVLADASLVAYWRFGTAGLLNDSGPNGLTLTTAGTAPTAGAGLLPYDRDGGAVFATAGTVSRANIPAIGNAWTMTGMFNIAAWDNVARYFCNFATSAGTAINFLIQPQGWGQVWIGNTAPTTTIPVTDGITHQWTITWDGTNTTFYLDGRIVWGPGAVNAPASMNLAAVGTLTYSANSAANFIGTVDETAIFARCFSLQEVLDLFTATGIPPANQALSYPQVVRRTPGLKNYWRIAGPGPWDDLAGGMTGTAVNTITPVAPGLIADHDGGAVAIPSSPLSRIQAGPLPALSTKWSWAFMFSTTVAPDTAGSYFLIQSQGTANGANPQVYISASTTTGSFGFQPTNVAAPQLPGPYNDGQPHFVVVTWDASTGLQRLYVDGRCQLNHAPTTGYWGTTGPGFFQIGGIAAGGAGGSILDEIAIWDHALTPMEIAALTSAVSRGPEQRADTSYYSRLALQATPWAYWRMGDAPGPFADWSGNAFTALQKLADPPIGSTFVDAAGFLPYDTDRATDMGGNPGVGLAQTPALGNAWTMISLIKAAAFGSPARAPFAFRADQASANMVGLSVDSAGTGLCFFPSTTTLVPATFFTSGTVRDNTLHWVASTWNGTTLTIYVDGTQAYSAPMTQPAFNIPAGFWELGVGAGQGYVPPAWQGTWRGTVDEVTVYDRVLSTTELSNLFAAINQNVPGAVVGLAAAPDVNSVLLYWSAPAFTGGAGAPITSYLVRYSDPGGPLKTLSVPGTQLSVRVPAVGGMAYDFAVSAANKVGEGALSAASAVPLVSRVMSQPGYQSAWSEYVAAIPDIAHWWRLNDVGGTYQDAVGSVPMTASTSGTSPAALTPSAGLLPYDADGGQFFPGGDQTSGQTRLLTPSISVGATWTAAAILRMLPDPRGGYVCPFGVFSLARVQIISATGVVNIVINGDTVQVGSGNFSVTDGKPHLIAMAFDGALVSVYVDGLLRGSAAPTTPPSLSWASASAQFGLGAWLGSPTTYPGIIGTLDEAFVVARAITAQEAADLWDALALAPRQEVLTYPRTVQSLAGLRNWWRMGGPGPWTDSVGGLTTIMTPWAGGVGVAPVAGFVSGEDDGALSFNGACLVGTAPASVLPALGTTWSISLIFRADPQAGNPYLFGWWTAGGVNSLTLYFVNNILYAYAFPNMGAPPVTLDSQVHHVVLVSDGQRGQYYTDGKLTATSTTPCNLVDSTQFRIGVNAAGMTATLDELAIWDRPLTGSEVARLYAALVNPVTPDAPANLTPTPGLRSAALDWERPEYVGTSPVRQYVVKWNGPSQ